MVRNHEEHEGVYWVETPHGPRLATVNLAPGISVYGEQLIRDENREYRVWDPYRSKLSAAIMNGLTNLNIKPGTNVLYLGAASGTTVSHVSDLVTASGTVFAVEFSARVARELMDRVVRHRPNVVPIIADARMPSRYLSVYGPIRAIYCDIAQPDETEIALLNADTYLEPGGLLIIAVKARSIDVAREPVQVFKSEMEKVERAGYRILETVKLEPYDKDHLVIVARKQPSSNEYTGVARTDDRKETARLKQKAKIRA